MYLLKALIVLNTFINYYGFMNNSFGIDFLNFFNFA